MHRNYLIEEVACLLDVHRNTVRNWIKAGLETCDRGRPTLIRGRALQNFLVERRVQAKRPLSPGQLYCLRCRTPRQPAGGMLDYLPAARGSGNLTAICEGCSCLMYRRVRRADIDKVRGDFIVAFPEAERHIGESV